MQPVVKLVILGRDGVLNVFRDDHVKAAEEWCAIPGALPPTFPMLKISQEQPSR